MAYLMVRHKVQDFDKWKPVFDRDVPRREDFGIKVRQVFRNIADPNEVIMLFESDDMDKAARYLALQELREAMKQGGVMSQPELVLMESAS